MSWKAHQISRAIKRYDRALYAEKREGRIDIFRKTYAYEPVDLDEETRIQVLKEIPYRVFCLTDTWTAWGRPVDWGIEPVMAKLKSCDLWQRNIGKEVNEHNEKIDASNKRDHSNKIEAFVKDYRRDFAKTFEDVNTANMSKQVDRRLRDERKIKKG